MAALDKIPAPALPPGSCLVCNRATDPLGFFDLGGSIPMHGALYLCGSCAVEIARKMRWSPPEAVTHAQQQARAAQLDARAERAHTAELEAALSGQVLALSERVTMTRLARETEETSEPDVGGDAGLAGGGSADGGGVSGRRRRGQKAGAGDGAPAGPGAGDLGSGALADAGAAAGPDAGGVGGSAVDHPGPTTPT